MRPLRLALAILGMVGLAACTDAPPPRELEGVTLPDEFFAPGSDSTTPPAGEATMAPLRGEDSAATAPPPPAAHTMTGLTGNAIGGQ